MACHSDRIMPTQRNVKIGGKSAKLSLSGGVGPMNPPKLWFGKKRIGWGYGPRTWEGWAVIGLFIAACIFWRRLA
jgi:hypothetical protein